MRVYLYFATLVLLVTLAAPAGTLVSISTAFVLKNQLHAWPSQVALFSFVTSLPLYLAFLFGLTRDRWNPFGLRDRGFLLLFASLTALALAWIAQSRLSFLGLFAGMMVAMIAFQFVSAAYTGLMALVGQEQLMSGRLASLAGTVGLIPAAIGASASGWLVEHVSPHETFLTAAALALCVALIGLWKPPAVFEQAYGQPIARGTDLRGDVKRLLKHRAIYPALAIVFLDQFMPGGTTPMQYYLTDRLHAPDEMYGYYMAIFVGSFIPTFLLYAWLCKRITLEKLLWWGTVIMIPQTVPLAFIHSGNQALLLAMPLGLLGGVAGASYLDLAMRTCPPGLQGTYMMLSGGLSSLSAGISNVVGAAIYSASPRYGFLYDVIAMVLVFTAILPMLKLIPREIVARTDGEHNAAMDGAESSRESRIHPLSGCETTGR